ncbi:MAG: hypothetical protein M3340_10500 [Actinomycetota bacterium]|nr:hypothetical protein [Actinomycetota bacterium]
MRRVVLIVTLLALAAPAQASAVVTIKLGSNGYQVQKYREVLFPDTFRVKGKTGDYRGNVTLEMDEYPFDGYGEPYATVHTNDKGEYVFPKVGPTRNALIRVRAGDELSRTMSLFVHPGVKLGYRTVSNGRKVRISFTYSGHPGFAPPQDSFYVYIVIQGRERVRRLGGARKLAQVGDGRWRFARTLDLPRSRREYRYSLLFCTRGLSANGYGRAYAIDRHCGERSPDLGDGI